jgi:hypothetical protein
VEYLKNYSELKRNQNLKRNGGNSGKGIAHNLFIDT